VDAGRPDIGKRLREALARAKTEYQTAKTEYDRLMVYAKDLGNTHPDGATSFRSALRQRNAALMRYNEALVSLTLYNFNRSILENEPPDETGPPR